MAKTAVITGSSRGIGAAIALRLAKDGCNIALNAIKNYCALRSLLFEKKSPGGGAISPPGTSCFPVQKAVSRVCS